MNDLTVKEIAQRIVNNANHIPENEVMELANAYLELQAEIKRLNKIVDAAKIINKELQHISSMNAYQVIRLL